MKKTAPVLVAMLLSLSAFAIQPFIIMDIKVDGLERLDAGTVFNYLPLKVGDEMNDEEAKLGIRALFDTGFFRDVQFARDGDILVVNVVERPSIASITINGNKKLKDESLQEGLRNAELVEGRIFNRASLEVVEREIQQAYLSLGRYSATVATEVEELERNRVALTINIEEGRIAKIKKINIIGAQQVSAADLRQEIDLIERKGWRLFTARNQYSRQKLEADVERIRSYYLNRGFHDFKVLSTNIDISPNKQNIFINIAIEEGEQFVFGETTIETIHELDGLQQLITIKPGKSFSRKSVNATRTAIVDSYADAGYAFVEVIPVYQTDRENKVVSTLFTIDPKQRVYVRKIEISGNTYTRDQVIRRELRQFEGAWYSASAVRRSRERLNRLGFFENVSIETPAVPGISDQVDIRVGVTERSTGSIQFSAGYSDADGALFGVNYQQRNVFGTGRELAVEANNSRSTKVLSINWVDPYHTADGISRAINLTNRQVDSAKVNTAEFILDVASAGVKYKIPIAETNSLNIGGAFERLELSATTSGTPDEFKPTIEKTPKADDLIITVGVSKDSRNDFFFPTQGGVGSVGTEITVPGSDFEYFKINLQGAYYIPLSDSLTVKAEAGVGYGDGFGGTATLPFFKNYYAGGSKSVRGYNGRSLGPLDQGLTPAPIGGDRRVLVNVELLPPAYGAGASKDKRLSVFVDGGQVFGAAQNFCNSRLVPLVPLDPPSSCMSGAPESTSKQNIDLGEMRYSVGIAFNWLSPLGPLSMSYAEPINNKPTDQLESFQISFGTVFR